MLKIGITGQNGFIGTHLYNTIGLYVGKYERIEFMRGFFDSDRVLDEFVSHCDVIVHLAAINRHKNQEVLYRTNTDLVRKLIGSLKRTKSKSHVLFSSSSQEERDNFYGKSKREGRALLSRWASESGGRFTGMIVPNVFGPFGLPDYNSFISTFCYRLTHGEEAKVEKDETVKLIYVTELVNLILDIVDMGQAKHYYRIPHTIEVKVSEVLSKLEDYRIQYFEKGEIPIFKNLFEKNLFNTYRSFIDHKNYFPIKYQGHRDERGEFVEIIRLGIGGQVSFSTTFPGVTRGNHYHVRKIERFAVIKGQALIQLRRIGTNEVIQFKLDGNEPSYVDIPVWYVHNIKNIGSDIVYTNFWINEPYDSNDPDTYFEKV